MAGYTSSQKTRDALVNAAGELFAEHGFKAVTTRAIAEKAGENIGNIHYHFGGKEGLLEAAVDFSLTPWDGDPLGTYLEKNKDKFETKEGRAFLVRGMINLLFDTFWSNDKPSWCGSLGFQMMQRNPDLRDKIMKEGASPNREAFMTLYTKITGDKNEGRADCWAWAIISPIVFFCVNPFPVTSADSEDEKISFVEDLKERLVENALLGLGLASALDRSS
jgi:AcrR family transcriptional regulator